MPLGPNRDRNGTAPDDADLTAILEVATTVPDHGSLRPWRFAVVRGPARDRFGDALVAGLHEQRGSNLPDAVVAKMHQKAFAAPACVALIASPDVGANVPVWEQEASAACTGYAIVLAAQALGYGAIWKSAATVDAPAVRAFFALSEDERLLGWVNLGTPSPAQGPAPHRSRGPGARGHRHRLRRHRRSALRPGRRRVGHPCLVTGSPPAGATR